MAATESGSTDDPQAQQAADSPVAAGFDAASEPAEGRSARGTGTRAQTTQQAQPDAPADPEPAPDPEAMVVALLLPEGETWCAADGTPYRASGSQPVYVRRRHVAELLARGATEQERQPADG